MQRARGLPAVLILCCGLGWQAVAQADDDATSESDISADPELQSARTHFKLGVDLYHEGNFRPALIEFRTAYEMRPNYKLLHNLAQASIELQEYANAIDYLTRYLNDGATELTAARRQQTEQTIRWLKSRMANVAVTSNQADAEIYLDDTLLGRTPLVDDVAVSVGRHKFTARKPGLVSVESVVEVAAGEQRPLELKFEPLPVPRAAAMGGRAALDQPRHSVWSAKPTLLWAGIATGALAAGAVTMSLLTVSAENGYHAARDRLTTAQSLNDLRNDTKAKALVTDVLWAATLASATFTTVIFLMDRDESDRPPGSAALELTVSPSRIALRGAL